MSDSDSDSTVSIPDPTTGLIWFAVLTCVYFSLQYFMGTKIGKSDKDLESLKTQRIVFGGVYILLLIVGEYFINLNLTNAICGTNQWDTALLVTMLPWVVIFGILNIMLLVLPGWLAPFSNTFGYGVAKLSGLRDLANDIFKSDVDYGKAGKDASDALAHIYTDQSLLINEITQANFDSFWDKMKSLFNPGVYDNSELKEKLRDMVRLKDLVAEFVWYMLTGGLVTSVGYNYIVNSSCTLSSAEMKKRHEDYVDSEEKIKDAKDSGDTSQPRVYSTSE